MPLSCGDRPFLAWTYPPALSQVGHRFADTGELHCRRWRYPPCNWLSPTAPWYIEGYSDHHLLLECFPYRKSTKRLSFVLLHRVVSVLSARAPYRPSISGRTGFSARPVGPRAGQRDPVAGAGSG